MLGQTSMTDVTALTGKYYIDIKVGKVAIICHFNWKLYRQVR